MKLSSLEMLEVEIRALEPWPLPSDFSNFKEYKDYLDGMGPRYRQMKADLIRLKRSLKRLR